MQNIHVIIKIRTCRGTCIQNKVYINYDGIMKTLLFSVNRCIKKFVNGRKNIFVKILNSDYY